MAKFKEATFSSASPVDTPAMAENAGLGSGPQLAARRFGYWSAVLCAACVIAFTAGFLAVALVYPQPPWSGVEAYVNSFHPVQLLPFIPGLLLIPAFLALMACLHELAPPEKKALSLTGLCFAVVYAATISVNYFIQLTLVPLSIRGGDLRLLEWFMMGNPQSLFSILEGVGFFFMGLATLAIAPLFTRRGLERLLGVLFVLNAVFGLAGVAGVILNSPAVLYIGSLGWIVVFSLAPTVLSILFRRGEVLAS